MTIPFNNDWLFTSDYDAGFDNAETVRIPHTVREIPYNYIDCQDYQMLCGYKKSFFVPEDWQGKRILLRFDGAAHDATVYCNSKLAAHHACGYTAFTADLTEFLKFGQENTVTVRLDTRENLNIPPFGFVIDYLCYGGLYRDVELEVRNSTYIKNVLIENTGLRDISVSIDTSGKPKANKLVTEVIDADGKVAASAMGAKFMLTVPDGKLWSPDNPYLYEFMTGIQFLNFVADIFSVSAADRKSRIEKYASLFEITGDLNQPISAYSHGMKQKLAIISALLHEPKLIMMDEPFVGLDPKASHLLKEMMKDMCAKGCAIFFSTHVLEVAEKLCDKVAIIKGGKLIRSGTMEEVKGDTSLEDVFLELEEA